MAEGLQENPLAATGLENLIRSARADLTPAQMATLSTLDDRLKSQTEEEERLDLLEQLAGEWYRAGQPAISGIYAAQIAEARQDEDSWSIAATTFTLCLRQEDAEDKTRQFCADQAERAYQNVISLNPDNVEQRVNLALTYTDNPRPDDPMKGILQLRELVDEYPRSAAPLKALGRLAIRTGQLDRAVERLAAAAELDPNDPDIFCPTARVLEELGRNEESRIFARRCGELLTAREAAQGG